MKKNLFVLLVISLVLASMISCATTKANKETAECNKVADMLYEVTYTDYPADIPDTSRYAELAGDMACSGVRNGNYVGRNFDFFQNQCPTFVVHTPAKDGRYATLGVGRLANINSDIVDLGLPQDKLDLLAWAVVDGINEKGVVVNINVLSRLDWGDIPHTGTNPGAPELNVIFMPRAILDNCASADEAIDYLKRYNITPLGSVDFDIHIMISDPKKTYVVEFINNNLVAEEHNIMTNYFVNADKMPEHPDGLERTKILTDNYDEGKTMEGMYNLMKRVKYSNLYDASNKWYSELGLTYKEILNPSKDSMELLESYEEAYQKELEYIKENGYRESSAWWDTTHNSIYDIANKKLWVTVHERYNENPYEFRLK